MTETSVIVACILTQTGAYVHTSRVAYHQVKWNTDHCLSRQLLTTSRHCLPVWTWCEAATVRCGLVPRSSARSQTPRLPHPGPPGTAGGATGDTSGRAGPGGRSRPARRDGPGLAPRRRLPALRQAGQRCPPGPGSWRCLWPEGRKGHPRRGRKERWGWPRKGSGGEGGARVSLVNGVTRSEKGA